MGTLWQDLRYGLRSLLGKPAFTATAVFTLALGIAVTTVVFSWIDMVLLHPLPGTAKGERLVIFESVQPDGEGHNISYGDFRDYRDNLKLSTVAISLQNNALSLGEGENSERVWAEMVSGNYFDVMGVKPLLGRFFSPEEQGDKPGAFPVAIISARLWLTWFRGDTNVMGTTIRVNQREMTIIGVAPPDFYGMMRGLDYEMWVPLTMGPQLNRFSKRVLEDRPPRMFNAIARLKPGASIEQAQAEVSSIAHELAVRYPKTNEGFSARLYLDADAHGTERHLLRGPLQILMAMCLVVLLIACVNVANLLLARSVGRQNELSMRLALGASRLRIVQQMLTEALLLAALGTLVGVPLALWMGESISILAPVSIGIPIRIEPLPLNGEVLGFAILICIVAALVSGISPALNAIRADINARLKEEGRSGTYGMRSQRLRGWFVVSEVALALVALVGAGLFIENFEAAKAIHPGFDANNVLVSRFYTSMSGYTEEQRKQFGIRLRERLERSPGIVGVGYADSIPLGFGLGGQEELQVEGYVPAPAENMTLGRTLVAPGYFGLLRIPLLEGRDFTERDDANAAPVMIVNEPFARRFFAGQNSVGRKIHGFGKWFTIVGVVKGSKYYTLTEPARSFFFVPIGQLTPPNDIAFYIRTSGDPAAALPALRREATNIDPNAGTFEAMPLLEFIGAPLFPQRFAASLLSALGAMSLLLAAVGMYSVMAYAVSQRTHEIGIRLAVGATPRDVLAMVVRKSFVLVGVGLVGGVAAALVLTRLVSSMLTNVSATDPLIYVAASLFLVVVALLASYLPARRASRVDPLVALRHQ